VIFSKCHAGSKDPAYVLRDPAYVRLAPAGSKDPAYVLKDPAYVLTVCAYAEHSVAAATVARSFRSR